MAVLSYVVTDVFTDEAFGGNQLAVVFGGEGLSSDEMLSICRECASARRHCVICLSSLLASVAGSGRVRQHHTAAAAAPRARSSAASFSCH